MWYNSPFVLEQLAGEGLLLLVSPKRHVFLQVLPLLLVPQSEHLLLVWTLLLGLQFALKARREALQFLLPLILREEHFVNLTVRSTERYIKIQFVLHSKHIMSPPLRPTG